MQRDARLDAVNGGDVLGLTEAVELFARTGPDVENHAFALREEGRYLRGGLLSEGRAELEPQTRERLFLEGFEVGEREEWVFEEGEGEI